MGVSRCETSHGILFLPLMGLVVGVAALAPAGEPARDVQSLFEKTGFPGGLVIQVGCDDAFTESAGKIPGMLVQVLDTDRAAVSAARERLMTAGLYGKVTVSHLRGTTLPYADNLARHVVVIKKGLVSSEETARVLCPGGVHVTRDERGWKTTPKPWPIGIDHWTHFLHGPDNNAVAADTVNGPPRQFQWRGSLAWDRDHMTAPSFTSLVADQGRIFAIMDDGPTVCFRLPQRWHLIARDAFSGVDLWQRPMGKRWISGSFRGQPPIYARRLVAVGGKVYVVLENGAPVSVLDAASGKTVLTCAGTEGTDEIIVDGDLMLVSIVQDGSRKGEVGRKREAPAAVEEGIAAFDVKAGRILWRSPGRAVPLSLTVAGDRVFVIRGCRLIAMDLHSGEVQWSAALGKPAFHQGAVVVVQDNVVLAGADQVLLAFDAGSGEQLWQAPFGRGFATTPDILVIDGKVWATTENQVQNWENPGRSFNEGRDLRTGKVVQTIDTRGIFNLNLGVPHARCYRHKATSNYIFVGRDGVELIDIRTGALHVHRWIRGTCQYGVMPSNGLLYVPPHACSCYPTGKLNGFLALTSSPPPPQLADDQRLHKGPAYDTHPPRRSGAEAGAWPTYRGTIDRSGRYHGSLPVRIKRAWTRALGGNPTPVVVAEDRVVLALKDTNQVLCLDADTGAERWRFTADAMVDSPPSYHAGGFLFGCRDGRVYRLRAEDGELAWSFLAAPSERLICSHGRIESAWPVHGSVLIVDGKASVVAGANSFLAGGLHYHCLDAKTGRPWAANVVLDEDPLQPFAGDRWDMEASQNDILSSDGEGFFMRHRRFSFNGVPQEGSVPHLFSPAGFLDEAMHHRFFWVYGARYGAGVGAAGVAKRLPGGRIICFDQQSLYGFKTPVGSFHYARSSGSRGLFASEKPGRPRPQQSRPSTWEIPTPLSPNAMLLADNALFVAGPKGDIEASYDAFLGKQGGGLWAVSREDGSKLAEYDLEAPPRFDGLAAAYGRLYLVDKAGVLSCWAGE